MPTPGPLEIIIILVIVLIVFGPKRLPDLGRSLGRGMREFKESVTGKDKDELPEASSVESPEPATVKAEPTTVTPEPTTVPPASEQKS
jgi:sec-independent protein translocase protein TatA